MSQTLRIALAQFDFPVGAVERNAERIAEMIVQARDQHRADVVLFPELAISGYPPEDLLLRPAFLDACARELTARAAGVHRTPVIVGFPERHDGVRHNAVALLADGRVSAVYRKQLLPNYTPARFPILCRGCRA